MNILALLTNTDMFGSFSATSKELIAGIALAREMGKNQTLFMEGEKGTAIYLLATGTIQLSKSNEAGDRNVIVKSVKQGEIFAEVILFEEDRYPVTAIAVKNSLVFVISKKQFLALLENALFRDEFIHMLLRKQRYLTERLKSFATMGVEEKLFHFLGQHYGPKEKIVPGISKKDMAAAVDVTPETFSRLLLKLKKQHKLEWKGKEIFIHSFKK
jgi:CRP-like cAMP-binding protein